MADTAQRRQIRLLINDVPTSPDDEVFTDEEIDDFVALERGTGTALVKRAAALALETIASDEALTSKVITDRDLTTDGAKLSDALLARAKTLRAGAAADEAEDDDAAESDVFFALVPTVPGYSGRPELTGF